MTANTVAATAHPQQAELLEGPPPVARLRAEEQPAELQPHDVRVKVALAGVVLHDARAFRTADGRVYVRVLLQQRLRRQPAAHPVSVTCCLTDAPRVHSGPLTSQETATALADAQALALRLHAGVEALAIGEALYPGRVDEADVLVLAGVRALQPARPDVADALRRLNTPHPAAA